VAIKIASTHRSQGHHGRSPRHGAAGYELDVLDREDPGSPRPIQEAEYSWDGARAAWGRTSTAAPPGSSHPADQAGYDRLDVEAARRRACPSPTMAAPTRWRWPSHTLMLILAVYKRLASHHNNVVAGKWRVGDHRGAARLRAGGEDARIVGLGTIGKRWRAALRPSTCGCSTTTSCVSARTRRTPSASGSPCSRTAAHLRRGEPPRAPERGDAEHDGGAEFA